MNNGKKWFKLKIALLVVGIAVLLVGGAVFALPMVMEKNPKNLYLLAEAKSYEATGKSSSLWSVLFTQDPWRSDVLKQKHEMHTSMKGQLDDASQFGEEFEAIHDLLKQSEWQYTLQSDPEHGQTNALIALLYKENPLLSLHVLQNKEEIAIEVPAFYDRMIAMNLDQLVELFDEMYSPYGPDWEQLFRDEPKESTEEQAEEGKDWQSVLKMDEALQAKLLLKYGTLLQSYLTDEHVVLSEEADKMRKLTVTFSEEEIHRMTSDLIDTIRYDEELIDYLSEVALAYYGQVLSGSPVYYSAAVQSSSEADKEVFAAEIRDILYQLKLEVQSFALPDGIVMEVLIDKKERIVSRTLNLTLKYEEGMAMNMQLTTTDNWDAKDPRSTWNLKLTDPEDDQSSIVFAVESLGLMQAERGDWEAKGQLHVQNEGEEELVLTGTLEADRQKTDGGIQTDYKFSLRGDVEEVGGGGEFSGTVKHLLAHDTSNKQVDEHFDVGLQAELFDVGADEELALGLSFSINSKTTYGDQVEIRQMDEDRLNLQDLDEADYERIATEVMENVQEWLSGIMEDYPEIPAMLE